MKQSFPGSRTKRITAIGLLLVVGGVAQAQQGLPRIYSRNFPLDNVDSRVAEAWFWELCEELGEGVPCRVTQSLPSNPRMLTVEGPDRVHSAFSRRLAERDVGRVGRQFQVLLVNAAKGKTRIDPQLPEHARRAIEDVAEFLPFTDFQLIDSGWMKTSGRGQVELSGADGTRYEAALIFDPEVRLEGVVLQISNLHVRAVRSGRQTDGESASDSQEPRSRVLINSSLALELGETAVVGTSKLNGGEHALVVLLTAVQ